MVLTLMYRSQRKVNTRLHWCSTSFFFVMNRFVETFTIWHFSRRNRFGLGSLRWTKKKKEKRNVYHLCARDDTERFYKKLDRVIHVGRTWKGEMAIKPIMSHAVKATTCFLPARLSHTFLRSARHWNTKGLRTSLLKMHIRESWSTGIHAS